MTDLCMATSTFDGEFVRCDLLAGHDEAEPDGGIEGHQARLAGGADVYWGELLT